MDDEIVEKSDSKLNLNSKRICQRTFGPKKGYLNCPKCPPGRKPHKNKDCLRLHLTKKHAEVLKDERDTILNGIPYNLNLSKYEIDLKKENQRFRSAKARAKKRNEKNESVGDYSLVFNEEKEEYFVEKILDKRIGK